MTRQANANYRFHSRLTNPLYMGLVALAICAALTATTGCLPLLDRLAYVVRGSDVPAPYNGLEKKRTAIICVSEASAFGPDSLSKSIERVLCNSLLMNVKKIQLVPQIEIEKWIDENEWQGSDMVALGKGVKAERLVVVELSNYSIHEGKTLHKGSANVVMTVYELDNKKGPTVAHTFEMRDYQFPKNGRPALQSSDRQFEEFFLARVCRLLSNQFHKHDRFDSFADEAMLGMQ